MRSSGRSPFGSPPSLFYRLPIVTYPLSPLVSEIFDLKVADILTDKQTDRQTSTSTDNKGRLKLSAREPTNEKNSSLSGSKCSVMIISSLKSMYEERINHKLRHHCRGTTVTAVPIPTITVVSFIKSNPITAVLLRLSR